MQRGRCVGIDVCRRDRTGYFEGRTGTENRLSWERRHDGQHEKVT